MNEKEDYSDAVAQEEFDNAIARGLPYEQAVAAGQKAMQSAAKHYDDLTKEKEAYADNVGQQAYEAALAQDLPYELSLQLERAAWERAEQELRRYVNIILLSHHQYERPSSAERYVNERVHYGDRMGQQAFETALARGESYEEAVIRTQMNNNEY